MNLNDLDEDEFAHLAQWVAVASPQTTNDRRTASAWRFAQARFSDVLCHRGFRPFVDFSSKDSRRG